MNFLTHPHTCGDTGRSLKSISSIPANSLQGRIFYAPHSVSRTPVRLARSMGMVSGIRKDPDALIRVESSIPTLFGWFSISKVSGGYMPNTLKGASAPQNVESLCDDLQNQFELAKEQIEAATAILDAASVLCALERSPVHHDTHLSHNIRTGGGYAHGHRVFKETLPTLLEHAHTFVSMAFDDVGRLRERAIDALKGGAQ